MLLSRLLTATASTLVAVVFLQIASAQAMSVDDVPSRSCQVTLPSDSAVGATGAGIGAEGNVAAFGTDKLWTMLPVDGIWLWKSIPRLRLCSNDDN
jgi:hypothetical protein